MRYSLLPFLLAFAQVSFCQALVPDWIITNTGPVLNIVGLEAGEGNIMMLENKRPFGPLTSSELYALPLNFDGQSIASPLVFDEYREFSEISDLAKMPDGNFVACTNYQTLDTLFDAAGNIEELIPSYRMAIVQLTPNGEIDRQIKFNTPSNVFMSQIEADQEGNIYTRGRFGPDKFDAAPGPDTLWTGSPDTLSVGGQFLLKLNPSGGLEWVLTDLDTLPAGYRSSISAFSPLPSGELLIAKRITSSASDLTETVLQKYSSSGTLLDVRHLPASTSGSSGIYDIKTGTNGKIYLFGKMIRGQLDIDPGPGETWIVDDEDRLPGGKGFLVSLDTDLSLDWYRTLTDRIVFLPNLENEISPLAVGKKQVIVGFAEYDTNNLTPDHTYSQPRYYHQLTLASLSLETGAFLWTQTYTGSSVLYLLNYRIALSPDEQQLFAGSITGGTLSLVSKDGQWLPPALTASYQSFLAKFPLPEIPLPSAEQDDLSVFLFPNPFEAYLFIDKGSNSDLKIKLFDLQGKMVLATQSSNQVTRIDLTSYPAGLYLLQMESQGIFKTEQIVKR
jgi:hypothetical protein